MAHSPTQSADVPRIRLRSPAQLAAAIPYLVGFPPVESLVLVGLAGESPHVVVTMRIDLPEPEQCPSASEAMAGYLASAGAGTAFVVVATETGGRRPREDVLTAVERAAERVGIAVPEALLLRAGRWRSYHCDEPRCCAPEGTPVEASDVGELAAAAAYTGRVVHASRAHLVDSLAAVATDPDRTATDERALRDLRAEQARRGDPQVARDSRRLIRAAVQRRAEACAPLPRFELTRLATGLTDVLVRDWALGWVDGSLQHAAESLWFELTRHATGRLVAAPATLLAVHAYLRGDGAYARTALDRAQDADPEYPFARLLAQGLDQGVPPTALRAAIEASRTRR